jgi:hypothetical protein
MRHKSLNSIIINIALPEIPMHSIVRKCHLGATELHNSNTIIDKSIDTTIM